MGRGFISGVVHPSPDPFPLGKGGLSGLVSRNRDFFGDDLQDAIDIRQHVIVPEPDHSVAMRLDNTRTVRVRRVFGVLPAVQLYREAQAAAGEVRNEITKRELPREFRPLKLACAKVRPEALLGFRRIAAQLARHFSQTLFRQRGTPISNPFPRGKGLLIASRA